jgi:glycosyltransferase involved in cell wall biosynthesis
MKLRAWIIGNAPSLKKLDMTRLKDEPTFSFNRAYLAYEEWGWYPTYYCVIDANILKQTTDDVNDLIRSGKIKEFYLHADGADGIIEADNVHIIEFDKTGYDQHGGCWSFAPDNWKYCADVAAFALQVAYCKGYRTLYLAGVDQTWGMYGDTKPGADTDHFRPDYETDDVRMSGIYAYGHFNSWKKSIKQATNEPYNMELIVTTPESRLREFLPYQPFESVPMEEPVINYDLWREPKPFGISGCFRLRNESQFMEAAVKSFLPYLDEAVLLVQPSSDNTAEIAEQLAEKYPDKVRVYYYPYIVDWIDTDGFHNGDPEKPGHLVHMSNYALSKCQYSWICKVEGDVIALPTMQRVVDTIRKDPDKYAYYGLVILNLAGANMDMFSKENPRNGGWDEAVFRNNPDIYKFERRGRWEVIPNLYGECLGWAGIHMKRCKVGKTDGWNGETYLPLTRDNLSDALEIYNAHHPYPATDNPYGIDELFEPQLVSRWLDGKAGDRPTVSVILPTYNRPEFLDRALRTIHAQTFQDYEIVVVNDAGEDVSEIVNEYPKTVYVEHDENKGLAASRNTGIRVASGKYIAFLDDDDLYYPIHLEVLVNALNQGAVAAYTEAYRWEDEKKFRHTLSTDYSKERIAAGCPFYVMNIMLRSELFINHHFDESLPSHEDYDLWLELSDYIDFQHIPMITAVYSKRPGSDQISNQEYHRDYFDVVRKKRGVDHILPWHEQKKLKQRGGKRKVTVIPIQSFVANVNHESVSFKQGKKMELDWQVAEQYIRAGYVRSV